MPSGFHYDVQEGVVLEDPDGMDLWLEKYGFVPDRFVPVLGQYQAIRKPEYRHIVGTTAYLRGGIGLLNRMVIWATLGNSQFITASQRRAMIVAGTQFPKSPIGPLLRVSGWLSVAVLTYDHMWPLAKIAAAEFVSSLNPMNFNPFMG